MIQSKQFCSQQSSAYSFIPLYIKRCDYIKPIWYKCMSMLSPSAQDSSKRFSLVAREMCQRDTSAHRTQKNSSTQEKLRCLYYFCSCSQGALFVSFSLAKTVSFVKNAKQISTALFRSWNTKINKRYFLQMKPGIMMRDDKYSLCGTKGVKRREGKRRCIYKIYYPSISAGCDAKSARWKSSKSNF